MEIHPIAYFRSPFTSKFGIPRQSGILTEVEGEVVFEKPYDNPDAIRGIERFTHLWLVWEFGPSPSLRGTSPKWEGEKCIWKGALVRPPRLGGNEKIGVFASRSPFRPNNIGLSCVELKEVRGGKLIVKGADLMDGTPILDVKPYVRYADCHPEAKSGFTDEVEWQKLDVVFPDALKSGLSERDVTTITMALSQDPRPHYHNNPERVYGMPYAGKDVRFRVNSNIAEIVDIVEEKCHNN